MGPNDPETFHYRPECHVVGCQSGPRYKLAAPWTNGASSELKSYGLTCEEHLPERLARARASRAGLVLGEGEYVGEVAVYRFEPGRRDADLATVPPPSVPIRPDGS